MKNKIILGDCYELIKAIPDHSVDLIYTDIPYEFHSGGGGLRVKRAATYSEVEKMNQGIDYAILDEFVRVMKKIYIYIWCSKDQMLPIMDYFINKKGCLFLPKVWCKTNPTPFTNNTFLSDLEYCLVFREKGTKLNDGIKLKSRYYISAKNVLDKADYHHPCCKPLELVERDILHSSQPGDLILDPFAGSGTTCLAAKHLGRSYIGFEVDPTFHKIAVDRLNGIDANGVMNLFDCGD